MLHGMGSHVPITSGGDARKKQPQTDSKRSPGNRFVVKPRPMKARPGLNLDKIEDLLDEVEGPFRR